MFFFRPVDSRGQEFFRVGVALVTLAKIACLAPNWLGFFGNTGYVEWALSFNLFSNPYLPHLYYVALLLKPLGLHENLTVAAAGIAFAICLVLLALGIWARTMAFLAWLLHLTIANTAFTFIYGVDGFITAGLAYCIFMQGARRPVPLDRSGPPSQSQRTLLVYRLLQLHLCVVYAVAGASKVTSPEWTNGEALWQVLNAIEYQQVSMTWVAQVPWLPRVMGLSIALGEAAYPLFVWRFPRLMASAMIGLHLGIVVFMGLHLFGAIMIIWNIAAWWEHWGGPSRSAYRGDEHETCKIPDRCRSHIDQTL